MMKSYNRPEIFVTEFMANEAVAGCDRVVTGTETTTTYDKQTVYCIIGGQTETVFNTASDCSTSSSQWGVTEYSGKMYFVWFTYAGDTGSLKDPDTTTLDILVTKLGFTSGSGWHYAEVTSNELVTDVLGFSY